MAYFYLFYGLFLPILWSIITLFNLFLTILWSTFTYFFGIFLSLLLAIFTYVMAYSYLFYDQCLTFF